MKFEEWVGPILIAAMVFLTGYLLDRFDNIDSFIFLAPSLIICYAIGCLDILRKKDL